MNLGNELRLLGAGFLVAVETMHVGLDDLDHRDLFGGLGQRGFSVLRYNDFFFGLS